MSDNINTLAYRNEDDRCYGLAGMAVTLYKLGGLDRVAFASIDGDGPMVSFSHEYYFCGSPSLSPKAAWKNLVNNYYLTLAMALGNLLARTIVRDATAPRQELLDLIRSEALAEGLEACSLEEDEARNIFDSSLRNLTRVFSNRYIAPGVHELARTIARRRTMSGSDLSEALYYLNIEP